MRYIPSEESIAEVVGYTGMDRLQAYHHLQARQLVRQMAYHDRFTQPISRNFGNVYLHSSAVPVQVSDHSDGELLTSCLV
jgi:hypothetical protein